MTWIANQLTTTFESSINWPKTIKSHISWQPNHLNLKSIDSQITWIPNQMTTKSFDSQLIRIWHQLTFEPIELHTPFSYKFLMVGNFRHRLVRKICYSILSYSIPLHQVKCWQEDATPGVEGKHSIKIQYIVLSCSSIPQQLFARTLTAKLLRLVHLIVVKRKCSTWIRSEIQNKWGSQIAICNMISAITVSAARLWQRRHSCHWQRGHSRHFHLCNDYGGCW